jgi:hypothetical protein
MELGSVVVKIYKHGTPREFMSLKACYQINLYRIKSILRKQKKLAGRKQQPAIER